MDAQRGTGQDLLERIETLERENRLLKETLRQSDRMRQLWQSAVEELKKAKAQLEAQNIQLNSLYQVSATITRTLDLEQLFAYIMDTMEQALLPAAHQPMGIFLVEEGRMELAAHRGGGAGFVEAHQGMCVGDCLCGQAACGEIILSSNCNHDPRHTNSYRHSKPHGHLILPLKAKDSVVGVFYYYLPVGCEFDPRQLETFVAIGNQLGVAIDNARLYEATRLLTLRDALTGLGNRRYMEFSLDRELQNARRYGNNLSLLILDIDHFKDYNDNYGHLEGDRLLTAIADVIRSELRRGDLAVRYGGEEFLILLPHAGLAEAAQVAERVRRAVAAATPVTASVGVAAMDGDTSDARCLIEAADRAMYRAKAAGRNRTVVSGQEPA